MRNSLWFLPNHHASVAGALLGFPPENKLTGTTLLHLSALRRAIASAAHILTEVTEVHLVVPTQLKEESEFFLDPRVPRKIFPLELGLVGATNVPVVSDHGVGLVDFTFNAWGETELPHRSDARFATWLSSDLGTHHFYSMLNFTASDMVSDGTGTAILSETSLLSPLRNPGWDRGSIENELHRKLGLERFAWVPGRAHDCVFFLDENTALVQLPQESDPYFETALQIAGIVEKQTNSAGLHYGIETMSPSISKHSYLDALPVNDTLLLPSYGEDSDAEALQVWSRLLPELNIQQVDSRPLAQRGLSWSDVVLLIPERSK